MDGQHWHVVVSVPSSGMDGQRWRVGVLVMSAPLSGRGRERDGGLTLARHCRRHHVGAAIREGARGGGGTAVARRHCVGIDIRERA